MIPTPKQGGRSLLWGIERFAAWFSRRHKLAVRAETNIDPSAPTSGRDAPHRLHSEENLNSETFPRSLEDRKKGNHPYRNAPPRAFWSKAVSGGFSTEGMVKSEGYLIRKGDRVVSAGSCFASNLVPYIEKAGFCYLRTEQRHRSFAHQPAENLGYSNFSAAYGNIYTVRQLLQLFRRTSGRFRPVEDRWHVAGNVIDPYRPGLRYPARSNAEFDALTNQHLRCVRRAFAAADVFVLTLGLTESWISKVDGAVFPACPGTIAGEFDPSRHEFKNFTVSEIADDLHSFITELREINPKVRFILTVSPVPLVATATEEHVVCASIYSKSILRVAAQEAATFPGVAYFPAYEIVTGPQAPKEFFAADRRNVTTEAVGSVMGTLLRYCEVSEAVVVPSRAPDLGEHLSSVVEVECEELMADR